MLTLVQRRKVITLLLGLIIGIPWGFVVFSAFMRIMYRIFFSDYGANYNTLKQLPELQRDSILAALDHCPTQ